MFVHHVCGDLSIHHEDLKAYGTRLRTLRLDSDGCRAHVCALQQLVSVVADPYQVDAPLTVSLNITIFRKKSIFCLRGGLSCTTEVCG